jgi:hypothetical protein
MTSLLLALGLLLLALIQSCHGTVGQTRLTPQADAVVVDRQQAFSNFGKQSTLSIASSSNEILKESFLKFDLKEVLASTGQAEILIASLTLKTTQSRSAVDLEVSFVSSNWQEESITFFNCPKQKNFTKGMSAQVTDQLLTINVTQELNSFLAQHDSSQTSVTILISPRSGMDVNVDFNSKESSSPPTLSIAFDDNPNGLVSPTSKVSQKKKSVKLPYIAVVILIGVGIVFGMVLLAALLFWMARWKRSRNSTIASP